MSVSVLADDRPLYAAVDPDDAHHQRSQQEWKRLTRERRDVAVAYPAVLEAYTLVLYRLGARTAGRSFEICGPQWIFNERADTMALTSSLPPSIMASGVGVRP